MPVMDGYEATKKIREQEQFKDLPILAMTANVMKQDIEKVLAVGMNAHIAKPLDFDLMFITMAKWVHPKTQVNSTEKSVSDGNDNEVTQISKIACINYESSTLKNRPKLFKKTLIRFYDKEQNFEQRFKAAQQQGNQEMLEAHSLKGLAGTLGMIKLQELAFELETACNESSEDIQNKLKLVLGELSQVLDSIAQELLE